MREREGGCDGAGREGSPRGIEDAGNDAACSSLEEVVNADPAVE